MTITAPPIVDALPEPPNPADRLTFNSKAYPWSLSLGDMTTEMNSVASWSYDVAKQTETNTHLAQSAAAAAALQAPGTITTTTETITFGTGSKTFQVPTGKSYVAGQYVLVAQTSAPSNYMVGQVTSYDSLTGVLILNVVTNTGSGSASTWTFSLTSPPTNQLISGAANKATPVDTDVFGYLDSAASFVFKKFTWANIKSLFVGKTGNHTMAGVLTATGLLSNTGAIGYGVGAGGTVTQETNKGTAVVLNKPSGFITMAQGSIPGNSTVAFGVSNNTVANGDTVTVNIVGGAASGVSYMVDVQAPGAGVFYIVVRNVTGTASPSEDRLTIQFNVHKGARS